MTYFRYFRAFCVTLGVWVGLVGCTNYSSDEQVVNPPIIFGVTAQGTGHVIGAAALNQEIGFAGYRLFTGATEDAVRTATIGTDCSVLAVQPNQSVARSFEVKPGQATVTAGSEAICNFNTTLTSGQWITMRALIVKDLTSVGTSISSNAVQVP